MFVVAMAQVLMAFSFSALVVSIGGVVASFDAPATRVGTAIVVYSLTVAAFIMLGAKIGERLGAKRVFLASVALFGAAMGLVAVSPTVSVLIAAQGLAGLAAAALVPTLVVLIASHYEGRQRAQALGWLGASQAMAGVLAFLVAGILGTWTSWRYSFALLVVLAAATILASSVLASVAPRPGTRIDWWGAVLAAGAVILISVAFDNLNRWGVLLARPGAPFDLLSLSPAPVMVVAGIVLGQAFFARAEARRAAGQAPLVALEVIDAAVARTAVFAMFVIVALESAVVYTVPLYVQIVQGRSSLETAVAMMPFSLSIFAAAVLVVRLFDRFTPRRIARVAFVLLAAGLAWLAIVVRNDWSTLPVILGLVASGTAIGALATLLFDLLLSFTPRGLAGDAGALRGTANNLAAAVGTALIGALVVGLLGARITRDAAASEAISYELQAQLNLDEIDFVSNERLLEVLAGAAATDEQSREAKHLYEAARLRALKLGFLALAGLSLLAIVPAGRLPNRLPGDAEAPLEPC
jgi:MFS family permease